MPGVGSTIDFLSPTMRLKMVLFPDEGDPTKATVPNDIYSQSLFLFSL